MMVAALIVPALILTGLIAAVIWILRRRRMDGRDVMLSSERPRRTNRAPIRHRPQNEPDNPTLRR